MDRAWRGFTCRRRRGTDPNRRANIQVAARIGTIWHAALAQSALWAGAAAGRLDATGGEAMGVSPPAETRYFRRVYEIFIDCTSVPSGAFMNIIIVR